MDELKHHCRLCGSTKLNKVNYVLDLSEKVGLHQLISRDGSLDQLIRPCECRGQFAYAHKICLSEWIETTRHEYCDVCRFKYNIRFLDRSFFDWIFETQQLKSSLRLLVIVVLMYYLAFLGILVNLERPKRNVLDTIIFVTSCFVTVTCSLASFVYLLYAVSKFDRWRLVNRRVVVEANEDPKLETQAISKDVLRSSGFRPSEAISSADT